MESKVLNKFDFSRIDSRPSEKILQTRNLHLWYDRFEALKGVSIGFEKNKVHAIIGPSGCGKSTLLRCFNRMHELAGKVRVEGEIIARGVNLLALDPMIVRKRMGMVFQKPNPFPTMTIYENVLAGYRLNHIRLKRKEADEIVEYSLRKAALWNEVNDSLQKRGTYLSGGQQQRLCIARALAMGPEVLLLDEPTSALDPISTAHIESLILELRKSVTIIIVTHNLQQAGRISDTVGFMMLGELIEVGTANDIFLNPKMELTESYIEGHIG